MLVTGSAQASEGGGSTYNPGMDNFLVVAAPPPGYCVLEYLNHHRANELMDNAVNSAVPGVELNATAAATWFITAQLQKEMNARNRPEGTALWSKTIISF